MCGVFIPDRVLAGWWRSQWKASDRMWTGMCTTGCRHIQEDGLLPWTQSLSETHPHKPLTYTKNPITIQPTNTQSSRPWYTERKIYAIRSRTYIPAPFHNLSTVLVRRSQWSRGLRRRSAATRLLRSWVQIPLAAWIFVCCECCVLSGRRLCDELITRLEESYRLWCIIVCDLETSRMRPWPMLGRSATRGGKISVHHSTTKWP